MNKRRNTVPFLDENSEQAQNVAPGCGYRRDLNSSVEPPSTLRAHATSSLSASIRNACEISNVSRNSTIYPRVLVLERTGSLNVTALERSLQELIRHHGALATTMDVAGRTAENTVPVQLDVTGMSNLRDEQDVAVLRALTEEARHTFKSHPPPMRVRLLHSDERKVLLMTVPALTACEISRDSLVRALDTLYEMYSSATSSPVPDLQAEPLKLVDGLSGRLDRTVVDRHISYWSERLAGSPPPVELPFEYSRFPAPAFRRAYVDCVFAKLGKPLEALSKQERVTTFAVLMTGFQALLSRYTNQDELVIGAKLPGPEEHGTEGLITPQMLPMRTNLSGDPEFCELLGRVSGAIRRDGEYSQIPFEHLATQSEPLRNFFRNHVSRVVFSSATPVSASLRDWRVLDMDAVLTLVDLHVEARIEGEDVRVRFTYDSELFDHTSMTRMAGHYETLLRSIVAHSDVPLSKMSLLNDAERAQLLYERNDTAAEYPRDRCTHELFEDQVRRAPRAQAVTFGNQTLSYYELNCLANQLAHCLRRLGASPDGLIGICLERSTGMLAGLLGILKSGAAYVPLDPQYPSSRLNLMLEDSGVMLVVTEENLRSRFSGFRGRLVCIDSEDLSVESTEDCPHTAKPENLAYVIYTSGSTGKPKGVAIEHGALVNFLWSMRQKPGLTAKDTVLAVTTISFDIATLELYLPLIVGARVALASRQTAADGAELQQKIAETEATVMQATPATWRLLVEAGWTGKSNLKILCGGEAMPRDLVRELLKRSSELWNMYGPTETTVWSTLSRIISEEGPVTIGKPIANTDVYILDTALEPLPVGVPGELYIGGAGVARGYLNRPDLTAERFIPHPFRGPVSGARLYRTGDLARYRPNGDIVCLGRIDHQIKIRGFRIELGEIESVLAEFPGVLQNVVVAREDKPGDKRLSAYLVAAVGYSPAPDELRSFVKSKLPIYMVPAHFVLLEHMPLTPNGKVDHRALPKPEDSAPCPQREIASPRNAIESRLKKIWFTVLGTSSLGIHDNFFDLGGHSLLVAKLIREIDQAFGTQLSLASIFEAPTIAAQACVIEGSSTISTTAAIVPVQPRGSKPPLFCCGFDSGPIFLPLSRHMGTDQPLLCVGITSEEAGQLTTPYRMEDLAFLVARRIRQLQTDGPYHVGGVCAGGLLAYETARQLLNQGQDVALLALFEPQTPLMLGGSPQFSVLSFLARKLTFHLGHMRYLDAEEIVPYIRKRITTLGQRVDRLSWHTSYKLRSKLSKEKVRTLGDILYLAAETYRPQPYSGRAVLFQAITRPAGQEWDEQVRWRPLASNLNVEEVAGYHDTILVEPHVGTIAERLTTHLPQAGALEDKVNCTAGLSSK